MGEFFFADTDIPAELWASIVQHSVIFLHTMNVAHHPFSNFSQQTV